MNESLEQLISSNGGASRRLAMARWIFKHVDLDDPKTKGKVTFDVGRGQDGRPEAWVAFHPAPEKLDG
jgi:hypothetical protein